MSYYVIKDSELVDNVYGNKCTCWEGLLYHPTNQSPPTIFETIKEAEVAIKISKEKWPEAKFEIEDIVEDIELVVSNEGAL